MLLLIVLASYGMNSQASDQILRPCETSLHEYVDAVESKALQKVPGILAASVTVMPSFEPEWKVATSQSKAIALLTYIVFDRSVWHSSWVKTGPRTKVNDPSSSQAKAIPFTVPISDQLYSLINSEWARSISAASPSDDMGLDGETYNFYALSHCASTWSPDRVSRDGRLVEIVYALRALAKRDKTAQSKAEAQIITMLKQMPETSP